jgi:hypothetical protein
MPLRSCLTSTATLLMGGSTLASAMGSGPHPHLLFEIPSPSPENTERVLSLQSGESLSLILYLLITGILIWAFRSGKRI